MTPELSVDILKLVWPVLGFLAISLLSLLTWLATLAVKKLNDICDRLEAGAERLSDHETRISCMELRCAIYHKDDE